MANIKATIPSDMTATTVHGLYQWDYGRKLEITSDLLLGTGLVEVHFAHAGRKEAIVHYGEQAGGTLTVAIPDECLTQSSPVIAWVFAQTAEEGRTVLAITLPVEARTRPSDVAAEPPESYESKYTEFLAAAADLIQRTYTKKDLDDIFGAYINDLDALIGGGV
jgi:hypothetical protein